jgi:hypothetical protein
MRSWLLACLASGGQLADRLLIDSRPAAWRMMRRVVLRRFPMRLRVWLSDVDDLQDVSTMPRGV